MRFAPAALAALLLAAPAAAQAPAPSPVLPLPAPSAPARAAPMDAAQRAAIGEVVRDYLVKNPEVIQEAIAELERRQKEGERLARAKVTGDPAGPLLASKHQVIAGNPQGDVTLVEFFDYNCGYCKKAHADVDRLIAADKNLRVVLKNFPVLGPGSIEAAQVALAVKDLLPPAKMWEYHSRLLNTKGPIGRAQALALAREMGLDPARVEREVAKPEIGAGIEEVVGLGDRLGLTGTPSYVVGDEVVVGAVGYEPLKASVDAVRRCGKASC